MHPGERIAEPIVGVSVRCVLRMIAEVVKVANQERIFVRIAEQIVGVTLRQ